jgi:acyl-CoA synthetase (AMP-forming)/AMP-acid ligase II
MLLLDQVAKQPDGIAVIHDDRRLSFADLADESFRLGHSLIKLGLRSGDHVAILAQNNATYVAAYGVAELFGFTLVTVNYRLAAPEMIAILGDSRPRVLLYESRFQDHVEAIKDALPTIETYIAIDAPVSGALHYRKLVEESEAAYPPKGVARDESIAYIMYTSGTTGRAKGVMLGHAGQLAGAEVCAANLEIGSSDKLLLCMPLYHIGARHVQMAHTLRGASVIIHAAFDPARICRDVEAYGVTTLLLAPTMILQLLECDEMDRCDMSSIRTIVYSASPMPVALLERGIEQFGPVFAQCYGLTETGPLATFLSKEDHLVTDINLRQQRLSSAGRACRGCSIQIVDRERAVLPAGNIGEIAIRAPSNMVGYWDNPAATQMALQDGWLFTGDLGFLSSDGFLTVVDREKDMIVSGGENIYSREVEEALYAHPAVLEAAVIGVPHELWGETVKAILVLKQHSAASSEDIVAHCRTLIASYKKPTIVEFVETLPKLANGKINKVALRSLDRALA